MRYSLRTLLIVLVIAPPLLASACLAASAVIEAMRLQVGPPQAEDRYFHPAVTHTQLPPWISTKALLGERTSKQTGDSAPDSVPGSTPPNPSN